MATSKASRVRPSGATQARSLKIRLIEPAPPGINILSYGFYPRLGLPLIGAALKEAGHDVLVYCPQAAPIDRDDVASADLVGISTVTSTAPAAYGLADGVRVAGIPVVIGGPHPTFAPDDALAHADYVARGESSKASGGCRSGATGIRCTTSPASASPTLTPCRCPISPSSWARSASTRHPS
jgi:hypothetical protein